MKEKLPFSECIQAFFHCIALVKVKVFVLFSGTSVSIYLSGTVFIANLVVEVIRDLYIILLYLFTIMSTRTLDLN